MKKFNFGENLRVVRSAKGISQEYMASALKISQATYSRIERQETIPYNPSPSQIAKALEVPIIDLLPLGYVSELMTSVTPRPGKSLVKTPVGLIFMFGLTIIATDFTYQVAYGICESLKTSDEVLINARWTAAFITLFGMLYWIWRLRR